MLYYSTSFPAVISGFAFAWTAGVLIGCPDMLLRRTAWIALAAATLFAAAVLDGPGPLSWVLFCCALSMAALLPKVVPFDDALALDRTPVPPRAHLYCDAAPRSPPPPEDSAAARTGARAIAAMLALPLVGGMPFVLLFASARPADRAGAVRNALAGGMARPTSPIHRDLRLVQPALPWGDAPA